MTLAELVVVRDAVIAAHARVDLAELLLAGEGGAGAMARAEIGHAGDELERALVALTEEVDKRRNETGS